MSERGYSTGFDPKPSFLCLCGLTMILALTGCSQGKMSVSDITDEPMTAQVTVKDLPEMVPAYGVVAGKTIEVNLEAKDGPLVHLSQKAFARLSASSQTPECRVVKIFRNANTATGQAIAWLKPLSSEPLPDGDFVSAQIVIRVKQQVLTVPREAVYIKDGQTMALFAQKAKDGTVSYGPVTVRTGIESDKDVEIISGLKPGDEVVTQAGIGYLYPDFKANADD